MHLHSDGLQAQGEKLLGDPVAAQSLAAVVQATGLKPVLLTGRMFVRPNILRTLRRTMIRFLIELLVSPNMVRTVQTLLHSQLACNEMQASARTCGRRAADSMIENVG